MRQMPVYRVESITMTNFDSIIQQLQQKRNRLDAAIRALSSLDGSGSSSPTRTGRTISAAARARIAAAQRARWARQRRGSAKAQSITRRKISAAGLARIRAAQRARWAKVRARKK